MAPRIYFAHPINSYDTPLEITLLGAIYKHFSGMISVVNPSDRIHQQKISALKEEYAERSIASKKIMEYFFEVTSMCQGGVGLAFPDGTLGAGVYSELKRLAEHKHPIWLITEDGVMSPVTDIAHAPHLSIDDTRARVYMPDGSIRPYR